jgi:threonyl-tRNA synthetase
MLDTKYWVSLSVRGDDKSKYLGSDEVWNAAEEALESAAIANELPYKRVEGEGAFYGPKLDFMFFDSIGRQWQLATIQCDFTLPERFDLSFTNESGEKERPVVIHRAVSGSLERFLGVIIEHFGGDFPLWLTPVQVIVVPVSDTYADYAHAVSKTLKQAGIRSSIDDSNESLGKRVRNAETQHTPHILVLGQKELDDNNITLRVRHSTEQYTMKVDEYVKKVQQNIHDRSLLWW